MLGSHPRERGPYRDAVECVLRRCEELRDEIERIDDCAVDMPRLETVEQALAWEDSLRTRLEHVAIRGRDRGLVRRGDVAIALAFAVLLALVIAMQTLDRWR